MSGVAYADGMRPVAAAVLDTKTERPSEIVPVHPRTRDRCPTIEIDLRAFALEHTGPDSWSAKQDTPPEEEPAWAIATDPLVDVWPCDVPCVALSPEEREDKLLDHREAFVLSLLDGASSVSAMLEMESLPADDLLAVLCDLCTRGLITLDRSGRATSHANDGE